jgi:hypothetical protein
VPGTCESVVGMPEAEPNLALQRTPHRHGASCAIIANLGGAGPLSFVVRRLGADSTFSQGLGCQSPRPPSRESKWREESRG